MRIDIYMVYSYEIYLSCTVENSKRFLLKELQMSFRFNFLLARWKTHYKKFSFNWNVIPVFNPVVTKKKGRKLVRCNVTYIKHYFNRGTSAEIKRQAERKKRFFSSPIDSETRPHVSGYILISVFKKKYTFTSSIFEWFSPFPHDPTNARHA